MKLNKVVVEDILAQSFVPIENNFKLLSNYSDINKLLNSKKKDKREEKDRKYEYLCHNKRIINDILYEKDKSIIIPTKTNEKFSNLFYILLLLIDNRDIINYIFNFSYIKNINNQRETNKKIENFVLSMILLQMIDNYKNQDELYEEKNDIELKSIFEQNLKIRKNNKLIQEYHLDEKDVEINNIENIYSKIIISLIINDKIVDFEKTTDILTQLGLKTINITKKIFYDLLGIFNSDKEYITKYMISKVDDFSDEKKMNFYYILLTFIFKNDIYIYNIPLLLNARKAILTILKNNFGKLLEINYNNNNKEKNEFVIKKLCDESYYYFY